MSIIFKLINHDKVLVYDVTIMCGRVNHDLVLDNHLYCCQYMTCL